MSHNLKFNWKSHILQLPNISAAEKISTILHYHMSLENVQSFFHLYLMRLLNAEQPQIYAWLGQTFIALILSSFSENHSKWTELRNSMALPFNKTLDQNYSTLPINIVKIWKREKNNPPLSARKRLERVYSKFSFLEKKKKKQLTPAPPHSEHKKKISCPSMGEREPLFNGTMVNILLWRIASHSISQCYGAAAERGQQGWCRSGTLTLQTSQALRPSLCLQLTSSAHLCWPVVKSRVQCQNAFNGGVLRPQRGQTVKANHKTGNLLRVRHEQTLLSGVHLS